MLPTSTRFEVIVVGAGPAGASAALRLARLGRRVLLLERGEEPGAKNMFGGMVPNCPVFDELIPGFWDEAPWERHVVRRVLTIVGEQSSTSLSFESAQYDRPPYAGFTLFRPHFDRWLAVQARLAGATLLRGTLVAGPIMEDRRVVGVRIALPEGELRAPIVIASDGALSFLAHQAGLRAEFKPSQMALGVRALYRLPEQEINERFELSGRQGATCEYLGCTAGVRGGGFIYTQSETLAVGAVFHLDSLTDKRVPPYELLDRFVAHKPVDRLLKGARLIGYSAHLLPEGGYGMVPRLFTGGMMVCGDAAALCYTNGLTQEGVNLAASSGVMAAEVADEALSQGDVSARQLAAYGERLRRSFVLQDMKSFAKAADLMHKDRVFTEYPRLVENVMERIFRSNGQPKDKIARIVREELKGTVPLKSLVSDGLDAGRSLLW